MRSQSYRFFVPPRKITHPFITIDDSQALHHIRDVLRLGTGDQITCFDGQGCEYLGTIVRSRGNRVIAHIERSIQPTQHDELTLWLAQALPKGERFEWIVQKATELGVTRISPLVTHHTVVRVNQFHEAKFIRWQRIAIEAAQQSGRTTIPAIDSPQRFETFLQKFREAKFLSPGPAGAERHQAGSPGHARGGMAEGLRAPLVSIKSPGHGRGILSLVERAPLILMPTLAVTAIPLDAVLESQPPLKEVVVLIGPEGDFNREEVAQAQAHGARPVSLGPLTLRSETAALATLAILRYVLGRV